MGVMCDIEDEFVGKVKDADSSLASGGRPPPEGEDGGKGEHLS